MPHPTGASSWWPPDARLTLPTSLGEIGTTAFPSYAAFTEVCRSGLSVVRPMASDVEADAMGWEFGAAWPPSYGAFGRMRFLLTLEWALALTPRRALEVAAGGGALSACLVEAGADVVANDLRAEILEHGLRRYSSGGQVRVDAGNLFDLQPAQVGTFDLVVASEVIEHVADPKALLSHLASLLTPEGSMLLATPNGGYALNRLQTFAGVRDRAALVGRQFRPDADGHLFLLTYSELGGVATVAGLVPERIAVWGTPALTGHARLRSVSHSRWLRAAYGAEVLTQRLPASLRSRVCFALTAVLRRA